MELRSACQEDLAQVCQLYRDSSRNPFSVWNEEYPTILDAQQDLDAGNLFVLTEDGLLIGTISIVPKPEMDDMDIWQDNSGLHQEIARICIREGFHGRGLAGIMVEKVFQVLRSRGCRSVRLSAASCNLPALRTYQKLGFSVRGEADLYGSHYQLLEILL